MPACATVSGRCRSSAATRRPTTSHHTGRFQIEQDTTTTILLLLLLLLLLQLLVHPFKSLFSRTTRVSLCQKGKTSLDLNGAKDDGVLGCSGISWTICKRSAPRFRRITTLPPHHSIFTGRMLLLTPNQQCQSSEGNKIQQDTIPIFCGISAGGGTERDTMGRVCGKRIVFKLVDYRSEGKDWTPNYCCMCVS